MNIQNILTQVETETEEIQLGRRGQSPEGMYGPHNLFKIVNQTFREIGRTDLLETAPQPFYGYAKSGKVNGVKWVKGTFYTQDEMEKFVSRYVRTMINRFPTMPTESKTAK